jgi:hypothetical protein
MYIAHFTYENQNSTPVYIPVGPNNSISGSANLATGQPVLFLPGGGSWNVPFNNVGQLTWQIRSNKNDGTTGSIQANSSNVVCSSGMMLQEDSLIGQEVGTHPREELGAGPDQETGMDPAPEAGTQLRIYPNPSTGKVFVEFAEGAAMGTSFEVYSALGLKCPVRIDRTSDRLIELDLSSYGKGMYIINLIKGERLDSRTVIIE